MESTETTGTICSADAWDMPGEPSAALHIVTAFCEDFAAHDPDRLARVRDAIGEKLHDADPRSSENLQAAHAILHRLSPK